MNKVGYEMPKFLVQEALVTDGAGKFLLAAMFFNIPVLGFIPYLTQAFTIILLSFFLKHVVIDDKKQHDAITSHAVKYSMKPIGMTLIIGTMIFQVIWIPFVMQLVTLILLGIIYATMTKYKKKLDP